MIAFVVLQVVLFAPDAVLRVIPFADFAARVAGHDLIIEVHPPLLSLIAYPILALCASHFTSFA